MSETTFGGSSDTPCFALLDGRVTDPDTEETSAFRIPLTKLPAVLGRSHETDNPNFFGLGSRKALSRKQCVIYYQDAEGGSVEWDKHSLVYKKEGSWNYKNTKLKTPLDKLPQEGFFVMECLGRNSITVNRQKVEQGESIVLESGSPIRISQHRLYFLLPTDAPPRKQLIQEEEESSSNSNRKKATKKGIKRPSLSPSAAAAAKKPKGTGLQAYTESLEAMSTEELLRGMTNAIASNTWDRKNQMVGTVLVLRAVKDAARAPEIMELAKDNGVARSRVIEWIEKSAKYKQFVQQLQSKIEPRSYQAAITKAVLKAGYTRNGTAGRYVKWHLPPISDDEEEEDDDDEDDENDAEEQGSAQDDDDDDDDDENEEEEDANDDNDEADEEEEEEEDDENDNDNDVDMDETENNEVDDDEQVDEDEEEQEDEEEGGEEDEKVDDEESNEMETERPEEEKPQEDDEEEEGSETNHQEDDDVDDEEGNADKEDGDEMVKNEDDDDDEEDEDEEKHIETKDSTNEETKSDVEENETKQTVVKEEENEE